MHLKVIELSTVSEAFAKEHRCSRILQVLRFLHVEKDGNKLFSMMFM